MNPSRTALEEPSRSRPTHEPHLEALSLEHRSILRQPRVTTGGAELRADTAIAYYSVGLDRDSQFAADVSLPTGYNSIPGAGHGKILWAGDTEHSTECCCGQGGGAGKVAGIAPSCGERAVRPLRKAISHVVPFLPPARSQLPIQILQVRSVHGDRECSQLARVLGYEGHDGVSGHSAQHPFQPLGEIRPVGASVGCAALGGLFSDQEVTPIPVEPGFVTGGVADAPEFHPEPLAHDRDDRSRYLPKFAGFGMGRAPRADFEALLNQLLRSNRIRRDHDPGLDSTTVLVEHDVTAGTTVTQADELRYLDQFGIIVEVEVEVEVDVHARQVVRTISNLSQVHGVLVVPDLRRVYVTATGENRLVILDEDTGAVIGQAPTGDYPDGIAYDPTRGAVWTTNETGGTETVVDAVTAQTSVTPAATASRSTHLPGWRSSPMKTMPPYSPYRHPKTPARLADEVTLETWIEQCVAHLRDAENFDIYRPHEDEFLLLYGVAVRVMRYCDAYLHLVRSGFTGEAVVLARTALEHDESGRHCLISVRHCALHN
ncbi:hypothetical protein ST47_g866 [Ascochyta rabiei]|uniref:Uncharacterized protein n=1 Tax=Didymella rabiei TaxID=5454 RepID=A0A163LPM3_DIDRA|nr:hypothetical protein ST47_g866 [Ascochyta rabiei]